MSHCPTKDIHSLYLDNEMPEIYKAEYEAHLAECPECQKKLEAMKKLHLLLATEASEITPDSHYLDQSFERLQTKMKYSKNTGRNSSDKGSFKYVKYIAPAVAAAAAFALIIPIRQNSAASSPMMAAKSAPVASAPVVTSVPTVSSFSTVSNVSVGSGNGRVISGNIHESVLPPPRNRNSMNGIVQNVNTGSVAGSLEKTFIGDVDVFRPAFDEDNTISIRITVPGVSSTPFTTEIEVPVNVPAGQE